MINYTKLSKDEFIKRSISLSLVGDGIYCLFILRLFAPRNISTMIQKYPGMLALNPNLLSLSNGELMQLGQVFYSTAQLMLILVVGLNFFGYYRYSKETSWGVGYMKMLGLTGGILGLLSFSEGAAVHFLWGVILIALAPLYFYIYFGVRYHFSKHPKVRSKK